MKKEFRKLKSNSISLDDHKLLHNLYFIYSTENYCLRRIPRLVSLVDNAKLSQILSDHVSVIMDRLNFLDTIFLHYKTRPSLFRGIISPSMDNMRIFLVKDDHKNQKLINELIEMSRYRQSLYELLITADYEPLQTNFSFLLTQSLDIEEIFYQDLIKIKGNTVAFESLAICSE